MSQVPGTNGPRPLDDNFVSMDPAHQSLADALRITFRVLVLVMVLLGVLFAGSGVQRIEESQRGVKTVFGRITQDDVPPGTTMAFPFPIGEVIRVPVGNQTLELYRSFGPDFTDRNTIRSLADLAPKSQGLLPERDGSLVTGDGGIAHAWWTVEWQRDPARISENIRNMHPEHEREILRAVVERGVVRVAAELTIEQLL
ncbi:MAG: SPFH domain-containing protein, partial [Planctomycetota bacterium]|nr:SPFH domain-containing protein [Planctomycetota bacterium]